MCSVLMGSCKDAIVSIGEEPSMCFVGCCMISMWCIGEKPMYLCGICRLGVAGCNVYAC